MFGKRIIKNSSEYSKSHTLLLLQLLLITKGKLDYFGMMHDGKGGGVKGVTIFTSRKFLSVTRHGVIVIK